MPSLENKYRFRLNIFIFLTLTSGFGLLIFQPIIPIKEIVLSWEFNIYYLLGLYTIWLVTKQNITPYILFYLTCGLFIGGRFFAVGLGYDDESIFQPTFFYYYQVDDIRKIEIMRYVIGFFFNDKFRIYM